MRARSQQLELMDDPQIRYEEFAQTLHQLERINRLVGTYRPTLQALEHFARLHKNNPAPLRILDMGFGAGDMLRQIHQWAVRRQIPVELVGVDLNPFSKRLAESLTRPGTPITFQTGDALAFSATHRFDVILNAQMMHHLSDKLIAPLLNKMATQSRYGFFINDLHRHPIAYYAIKGFVRALPFNRLIRHDAPLSVARSFTRSDWIRLAQEAGLDPDCLHLRWHWPFRWGVRYESGAAVSEL